MLQQLDEFKDLSVVSSDPENQGEQVWLATSLGAQLLVQGSLRELWVQSLEVNARKSQLCGPDQGDLTKIIL